MLRNLMLFVILVLPVLANGQDLYPTKVVLPRYHAPGRVSDGTYTLKLAVTASGKVSQVMMVKGPPPEWDAKLVFERLLAHYIRQWEYPATGHARGVTIRVTYEFLLGDGPRNVIIFDGPADVRIRGYRPVQVAGDPA
jgi:hypothetical protein